MTPAQIANLPRGQIRWLVDRWHVGALERDIAADIRGRVLAGASPDAELADACARYAVRVHRANRARYLRVMAGDR